MNYFMNSKHAYVLLKKYTIVIIIKIYRHMLKFRTISINIKKYHGNQFQVLKNSSNVDIKV